jgi:propanediol utilization protein
MIVERSGNHCHLTQETFSRLFGYDRMTVKRRLLNENFFVAEEYIIYNDMRLPILGPFRKYDQIELSRSVPCARDWPAGYSGELDSTRSVVVEAGGWRAFRIAPVCIVSKPHVHMPAQIKREEWGTVHLGEESDTLVCGVPIYYDLRITVPTIHLDNDWYNAVNCNEGYVTLNKCAEVVRLSA